MTEPEIRRIEDLISQMTLDEKLDLLDPDESRLKYDEMPEEMRTALKSRNRSGVDYNYWMFRCQTTMTRLGIPPFLTSEALHGLMSPSATIFPQAITMSATFNRENAYNMGYVIGAEAHACGVSEVWSPVCDLAREPRYGRSEETYGEDEYLASRFVEQVVKGISDGSRGYVVSELKHFTAYGNPVAGLNAAQSQMGRHGTYAYMSPVFGAAIRAGAVNVMNSYNSIDDVPVAADRRLLTDLLRGEYGLPGFVRADMTSVAMLHTWHHVAKSPKDALRMAVKAGVDVQLYDFSHDEIRRYYRELLDEGTLRMEDVDLSVRRVLTAMTLAKVFDRPEIDRTAPARVLNCEKHRALALNAARESVILLKNNGVLPLPRDGKRIAVIGPNAAIPVLGDYCMNPDHKAYSLLDGLREVFPGANIRYDRGTGVLPSGLRPIERGWTQHDPRPCIVNEHFGLTGDYFNNHDLSGEPVLTRFDPQVNFAWIYESPDPRVNSNAFSVRWTGKIRFDRDMDGRLGFDGNDSVRLYLNGEAVIDAWDDRRKDRVARVSLTGGVSYDLVIEFKNDDRAARFTFGYDFGEDTIDEAAALAADSDIVILALGDSNLTSGENFDRTTLDLPGLQPALAEAVLKAGKPTVIVLSTGRPATLNWADERVSAVIQSGFGGEMGGLAAAEALFGDVNPAGRVTMTYPKDVGQIPCHYSRFTSCGKNYVEMDWNPAFPFGFGLSYTTFAYADLALDRNEIRAGEGVNVSFTVTNTGDRRGDVCPQVYLTDEYTSVSRPDLLLRGFCRVSLEPGETKRLTFPIGFDEMKLLNADYQWVVEDGDFIVRVGDNSRDLRLQARFRVIGDCFAPRG